MISLNKSKGNRNSYFKKSTPTTNFLFINKNTNESHWLLSKNNYHIIRTLQVSRPIAKPYDKPTTKAILYYLVKKEEGFEKERKLMISSSEGNKLTELAQNIDDFTSHIWIDEKTIFVIYQKDGQGYSMRINLEDFSIIDNKPFPNI